MNQFIFVVIQLAEHLGVVLDTQALLGVVLDCACRRHSVLPSRAALGPYSDPKRAKSPGIQGIQPSSCPLSWTIFPAYPGFQNSLPGGHAQILSVDIFPVGWAMLGKSAWADICSWWHMRLLQRRKGVGHGKVGSFSIKLEVQSCP